MNTGVRTNWDRKYWDRQSSIRRAIERLESRIDRNPALGPGTRSTTTGYDVPAESMITAGTGPIGDR